jgi:hypothetical protein
MECKIIKMRRRKKKKNNKNKCISTCLCMCYEELVALKSLIFLPNVPIVQDLAAISYPAHRAGKPIKNKPHCISNIM